jgi:Mg-chelatase subunit ChlI
MIYQELTALFKGSKDAFDDIFGQISTKYQLKSSVLSGRHVIIMGPPGIGKTTLVKSLSKSLPEIEVNDCDFNCNPSSPNCPTCKTQKKIQLKKISGLNRFVRVQGSPDLTVEDLLGDIDPIKALEFGPSHPKAFSPGKIFRANNGILFFDEINRCPEKLQNSLLQVLEEGIATISGYKIDIPSNFILIATMNPKDINTERLSDVLLDRFDVVEMSYPESKEIEMKIVKMKGKSLNVTISDNLIEFLVGFVRELRDNPNLELVPSVRASLGLYERSQANAILNGRKEVKFQDVKDAMHSVLSHRIKLKPSSKYLQKTKDLIANELENYISNNSRFKEMSNSDGEFDKSDFP